MSGYITESMKQSQVMSLKQDQVMIEILDMLEICMDLIRNQQEQITALSQEVYELAPEKEIIDTVADSEEERRAMLEAYMNHGREIFQNEALRGPESVGDGVAVVDIA